jgi:hypothetical protein
LFGTIEIAPHHPHRLPLDSLCIPNVGSYSPVIKANATLTDSDSFTAEESDELSGNRIMFGKWMKSISNSRWHHQLDKMFEMTFCDAHAWTNCLI